ncbi:MAG: Zn-ribbon domain-containing OB-fold protein [Candidatus Korarchaeota archaeon NZ13-K]|nr:MAG: Zn-ribbon domain-containing OB-fold protein [Candidatus Korarchaeota archaeon NZ13-K]
MWAYWLSVPSHWREIPARYRLEGGICRSCGHTMLPKEDICPVCGSRDIAVKQLPRRGTVVNYSVIWNAPRGYEYYTPYIIALVRLEDGTMVLSQLTDVTPSEVAEGMEVEMVLRKVRVSGESGIIAYAYKFRPLMRGD